ncbi:histidine kinase [Streptomyces chartreusis]|uniref:histidine kinase n=1 Tax=Streptomyces chartreusis TaxID=1969 RepID=UPI003F4DD996
MNEVPRGRLKVYLGAAPGVGKTYRMLDEARRRAGRGADVVVAFAECHGRPRTAAMLDGLEVVPPARCAHRGGEFEELDLAAVLDRRPEVAVVDDLAHGNVPGGGRNAKRWQDVEALLAAGTDVITAVDVQHLESLKDVVEKITGVPQHETVPDEVVRRAPQVELVDIPPEGLRRRMAHGNICAPERIDAALANYFRPGNLTALRQLALLWLADRVDEALNTYRAEHAIGGVWETRERVVVALTGGPEGDTIVRRAARIAARSAGGDLLAVHVTRSDGLSAGASHASLARQRRLVEGFEGHDQQRQRDHDQPGALLELGRGDDDGQDRSALHALECSWAEWDPGVPLVRLSSERRALGGPIAAYVRDVMASEPAARVTVLIPETEPERLWQRLLQNQRGAVVAHAVRKETDAVICRLRFRLF